MVETDHVRIRGVARVRVLVVLRHQRHRHVTDRAWIRLHVRDFAYDFRHGRHLRRKRPVTQSFSLTAACSTGFLRNTRARVARNAIIDDDANQISQIARKWRANRSADARSGEIHRAASAKI